MSIENYTPQSSETWRERFDFLSNHLHRESGMWLYNKNVLEDFIAHEIAEAERRGAARELEVLAVHLDKQLAGYDTVRIGSVYVYIDERQKALLPTNPN